MVAKIKDVASLAGVSTATVSHVINNTRYVSDEVKKKVNDAMQELNYLPNPAARSLRRQRSNIIGLIVPIKNNDSTQQYFMSIASGIESVLKKHGYHLLLSNSMENAEEELERIKVFNSQHIEGLIIAPTSRLGEGLEQSPFGSYPVVYIDRKPPRFESDCVVVDGFSSSCAGVKLLIDRGHKRIGFLSGGLEISSTRSRFEAYEQALRDHGLPFDEALIRKSYDTSWKAGCQLTAELVERQGITALFAANNTLCLGATSYLRERNIRIPEDFGLLCYDDYEWTEVMTPSLTVIRQPTFGIGEKAAELLLQRISSPKKKSQEYLLPGELIRRGSI
ncbi:LacI family DNA-binding transcriptional regulator [Paenibacillus mucilaginosus]|uniref:LacI family transcriptional regulator n=2 Tax=Paenibacillus mucilaginosus TaxID=61624 RepID=H6NJB3_9BACL|nr:LacI family DNA-binding transcriptional regulator [Paenibacillus mucilaginosus]AFC29192.1 LacI family transcriptional regulator [Paenibacillus mucilaginosus 3016]AFH61365.1 LacI family transcriptional regulator [Paenibacillus mucilaginosus K02]MCG7216297.1 LacI family transcriptional regulator [Paenibacillus mucilaginosus]WDM29727.1 LacI family DNA-binding transcriptional regulator [Paenibacillus mucilaginosus]WFA17926.1 LacI family transcriptional regulator [Paenibacillus mucilaginosus]